MSDLRQAKLWIKESGADSAIADREKVKKIALSLVRGWRRYKKTGRSPWSGGDLYDYTYFLHEFADRYAGPDDALYKWLCEKAVSIMEDLDYLDGSGVPNRFCPVCGRILTAANVARTENGEVASAHKKSWCQACAEDARLRKLMYGSF